MKALALLALTVGLVAGCAVDDSTLTVRNSSSFAIMEINLSPVESLDWGEDLLGADILEPGDSLEIGGIECGDYDVRVLDEDRDECILEDIDLCFEDAVWSISDGELALCAVFGS